MVSKVFMICDAYESGFGHGLKLDGLDLSKTPHGDPELGEAYQIGYEAGAERAAEAAAHNSNLKSWVASKFAAD